MYALQQRKHALITENQIYIGEDVPEKDCHPAACSVQRAGTRHIRISLVCVWIEILSNAKANLNANVASH